MLVTSRFLVLNVPKSGSSFVRAAVKAVYVHRCGRTRGRWQFWRPRDPACFLRELFLPNIRLPGRPRDQHGTARQIPRRFRDRAIVSVVRNPYEKLVSEYRFRWWATHPPLPPAELRGLFPRFPDLDLDDFLRLTDHVATRKTTETMGASGPAPVGNMTAEFLQFFFRDPAAALRRLDDDDYVASGAFRRDMVDVRFLRQEGLAAELATFLAEHGFTDDEAAVCRAHRPVNVTGGTADEVRWTRWGLAHFASRERHLFAMLAALGFHHAPPLLHPPLLHSPLPTQPSATRGDKPDRQP